MAASGFGLREKNNKKSLQEAGTRVPDRARGKASEIGMMLFLRGKSRNDSNGREERKRGRHRERERERRRYVRADH